MKEIKNLLENVPDQNLRNIHFFNGRILTAEDMGDEQTVQRIHNRQLGRALGEGIINGLEVELTLTPKDPISRTLSIKNGTAINRKGQCLSLSRDISLTLVTNPKEVKSGPGLFIKCEAIASTMVPTGLGVYVILMSPASGFSGSVTRHTSQDNGRATGCGSQYEVEGVQFRTVELDVMNSSVVPGNIGQDIRNLIRSPQFSQSDQASLSRLRNLLAHLCLGTEEKIQMVTDPFEEKITQKYGALDYIRASAETVYWLDSPCSNQEITDCDVPLALVLWSKKGIEFVDMWSVRRLLHPFRPINEPVFPSLKRQQAEAEACFYQFQNHLWEIIGPKVKKNTLLSLNATDYFNYLPPVGFIPIFSLAQSHSRAFFKDLTHRKPIFMEGSKVMPLLQQSFGFFPIKLDDKELIWLYFVHQNGRAVDNPSNQGVIPYLLFSSGQMPFQGDAHYDLNYYNYANYGPFVVD